MNLLLAAALLLQDKTAQAPPKLADGVYSMCDEVSGYSGEIVELKDGKFRYWFYSDVLTGREPEYPLNGDYRISGTTLILDHKQIHSKERSIAVVNGINVLWREDGLKLWEKEKRIHPYAVLLRMGGATDGSKVDARPSIKSLYTKEMVDREKKEYEERYNDLPTEVRVLLRAHTLEGDPHMDTYKKEITRARVQPDPKLLAQLVGLLGRDSSASIEAGNILEDLYTETWLIKDSPPFHNNEDTRKKAFTCLIDALSSARDRNALEDTIMLFLRVSGAARIDLDIPEAGARIKLEYTKEGAKSYDSRGPDVNWLSVISKIIPPCQKWMRDQIAK
jgi:hypothetical protein